MDLARIKASIERWQANPAFHPLTCGEDSNHEPLNPVVEPTNDGERLVLVCPTCGYRQDYIPSIFVTEVKCTCGVGDVFYSHLHEKGCPVADDPAMKAPEDPKDKLIRDLDEQLATLKEFVQLLQELKSEELQ